MYTCTKHYEHHRWFWPGRTEKLLVRRMYIHLKQYVEVACLIIVIHYCTVIKRFKIVDLFSVTIWNRRQKSGGGNFSLLYSLNQLYQQMRVLFTKCFRNWKHHVTSSVGLHVSSPKGLNGLGLNSGLVFARNAVRWVWFKVYQFSGVTLITRTNASLN